MAFVYPNVSKLNENYKNRTKYYDQTEDLFTLKAAYNLLEGEYINFIDAPTSSDVDANKFVSTTFLGFFTFKPGNSSDKTKGSAGCLDYSKDLLYEDKDGDVYCNDVKKCNFTNMLKIYDDKLIGSLHNSGFEKSFRLYTKKIIIGVIKGYSILIMMIILLA